MASQAAVQGQALVGAGLAGEVGVVLLQAVQGRQQGRQQAVCWRPAAVVVLLLGWWWRGRAVGQQVRGWRACHWQLEQQVQQWLEDWRIWQPLAWQG